MSQVAPISDVLTRLSVAMTANWQRIDSNPSDRDGFFLHNTSSSETIVYRLLEAGGTAPTGAGALTAGTGRIGAGDTVYISAGSLVEVYAYAVSGTPTLVMQETA